MSASLPHLRGCGHCKDNTKPCYGYYINDSYICVACLHPRLYHTQPCGSVAYLKKTPSGSDYFVSIDHPEFWSLASQTLFKSLNVKS